MNTNKLNATKILNAYDVQERINPSIPGFEKFKSAEIVKLVSPEQTGSIINYFNFEAKNAQKHIESELAFFKKLGRSFEWKVYSHDTPLNIGKVLTKCGFIADEPESFMVLDLDTINVVESGLEICTEVSDESGIRDAIRVQEAVWNKELTSHYNFLKNQKFSQPESIKIYVIYQQGQPVSSAWVTFNEGSEFAGIWGGSTLKAFRGQGLYSALLHTRILDAQKQGVKFLTIDASPMSRPIVEKHGFQLLSTTTPYHYSV
jgi:predicted GNAT family acetyltransferase